MKELKRKFIFTVAIIILFFSVLVGKIWYLQILHGDEYEQFSNNNRIRNLRIAAPRGRILDRNGKGIVTNRSSFDLFVVPDDITNQDEFVNYVSKILEMDQALVDEKLNPSSKNRSFDQVLIAQDISRDQLALIESRKNLFPFVFVDVNQIRQYNYGDIGANFLGYIGRPTDQELEEYPQVNALDVIGKSGIEKFYQKYLKGTDGYKQKVTDAMGREIKSNAFISDTVYKDSIAGSDVRLAVDYDLQQVALKSLGDMNGAIVVMNVNTGEILAMVSKPSFDPSRFVKGIDSDEWKKLTTDKSFPLLNRDTKGLYPPGSVYKIVTALAALQEKVINPSTKFYCPGYYMLGRKMFRCWKHSGHGWVDINKAIVESCDVFFYQVAERLGIDRLHKYSTLLGYGHPTGIDIEEKGGISPSREWKIKNLDRSWYKGDTTNVAIGQGYLSVTPLQVAVMTSIIANGGHSVKPHIVDEVTDSKGNILYRFQNDNTDLKLDKNNIEIIRKAMTDVVNSDHGTARRARIDNVTVAGKTGTAQVVALSAGKEGGGKFDHHAWFTSFAPAEKPEIAVTVLVEHGGMGGAVASPVARSIIDYYFNKNRQDIKE